MKIDISEVESTLLEKHFDPMKVQEVIRDLEKIIEELKADKDQTPKSKYNFVIVLNDKEGYLDGKEIAGWVVQNEEGEDPNLILSKLRESTKAQNEVTKKKKNFITDLLSAFEYLKPKFVKEKKLKIKTKELTRVLITNGKF